MFVSAERHGKSGVDAEGIVVLEILEGGREYRAVTHERAAVRGAQDAGSLALHRLQLCEVDVERGRVKAERKRQRYLVESLRRRGAAKKVLVLVPVARLRSDRRDV